MKVVILSCNTGGGHNSAARAIQSALLKRGVESEIVDALRFMPRARSRVISKGHVFAYKKLPKLYGVGYRFEENHTPKGMYRQCAPASEKLYPFLREGGYGAAICVHVFPALMLTAIRRNHGPEGQIPAYFVSTDYTCSPGVGLTELDRYYVPRELTQEFAQCGIPLERILETGIPVDAACYPARNVQQARQSLGLDPNRRQVVVSCGSMGCGPMRTLALMLSEKLPGDTDLTILCGNNRSLKRDLKLLERKGRVRVLGFTDQMYLWLAAADVMLGKPGGLTSTECMTMGVPFICIDAVPGCETRNLQFFCRRGLAVTAKHVPALTELTLELLADPNRREEMTRLQREWFAPQAAQAIAGAVLDESGKTVGRDRLERQFAFLREIDREKEITRQTYLASGSRKEGDAEHAWHLAIMTLLLGEYANEEIDVLKTVAMVLIHDLVEIDAGDTYAYDEEGKRTQQAREAAAAERIFGLLPADQAKKLRSLWEEFEARETPEAKFARTMDNVQPILLNDASDGRSWAEHGVCLSQVLKRNERTGEGSRAVWDYAREHFILPHVGEELIDG